MREHERVVPDDAMTCDAFVMRLALLSFVAAVAIVLLMVTSAALGVQDRSSPTSPSNSALPESNEESQCILYANSVNLVTLHREGCRNSDPVYFVGPGVKQTGADA